MIETSPRAWQATATPACQTVGRAQERSEQPAKCCLYGSEGKLRTLEDDGDYRHSLRKSLSSAYSGDVIPVEISFKDSGLQALMSQGKIDVSSNLSDHGPLSLNKRGLSQFEFLIGPMGNIDHENAKVGFTSHTNMAVKCEAMAAALGRPFSYWLGDSLDRPGFSDFSTDSVKAGGLIPQSRTGCSHVPK